jgi:hypothetical protein
MEELYLIAQLELAWISLALSWLFLSFPFSWLFTASF